LVTWPNRPAPCQIENVVGSLVMWQTDEVNLN
jgi:hypothetical protein